MRVFACAFCGQLVYFENSRCKSCGHGLGFEPAAATLVTVTGPEPDGPLTVLGARAPAGAGFKRCANAGAAGCNWLVPVGPDALCRSCAMGRRIPDLTQAANQRPFREAETAKRRLIYALMRFGLPMVRPNGIGLVFDILSEAAEAAPVLTGHSDGLITINLAEADPAERERRRHDLGETYRTLLGHFRHEVGHFYWDALVADAGKTEAFRALFGDERRSYAAALQRHYAHGAPADWRLSFVSAYATMHPWEDFAETWAHYLHIVDALDTAEAFGIGVDPGVSDDPALTARIAGDPYRAETVGGLVSAWLPLSYALNSLNRSLGQPDLYPFLLSDETVAKLGFVHSLIRAGVPR